MSPPWPLAVWLTSKSSLLAFMLGVITIALVTRLRWNQLSLPPSPSGLPVLGHLHLMPPKRPWIWFGQLARSLHSPLVYLNLGGQDTVIINDYHTAVDLLDKKSSVYSSRPRLVLSGDYVGSGKRLVLLPYGPLWRTHRAAFHQEMNPPKIESYGLIQTFEARLLMRQLYHSPDSFIKLFQQFAGGVILKIAYGLESDHAETHKAVDDVTELMRYLTELSNPGNLVDIFPVLDLLPDFLAPWRPAVIRARTINQDLYKGLVRDVINKVEAGQIRAEQTFASRLWFNREKAGMDELDVAYLSGSMFEAGTDTTGSSLATFVLASITHPDVYLKAQEEVDRVCGDQPPSMSHFESLEYIRAMVKETLRWRPVTPGGFPHLSSATKDDTFRGHRIPAGAVVLPNHWEMCFSSETYGQIYNPQRFEPRRWIERLGGVGDLTEGHPAFGFGRRICPGRHLAANSLYIVLAHLCYYFDIRVKDGVEVDTQAYTTGINIKPEPFECDISPRENRVADLNRQAEAAREGLRSL